jgi:glyoxylase-like metal-dependent hydrolase (beta-lactamase superfamily II)
VFDLQYIFHKRTHMLNPSVAGATRFGYSFKVAENVWGVRDLFVNVYLIFKPETNSWVLVDTGLRSARKKIHDAVAELFSAGTRLDAIILTHGHADHTGSVKELAESWDVEVYAHALEHPYLNGKSSYPPPDPTVGGGLMSLASGFMSRGPIDISERLRALPEDGSLPMLDGWKYYHTPGHAPGHISLFRERDKLLIAGDAFVTTKQESVLSILTQAEVLSGPPKYFTCDWKAAEKSVQLLADLLPDIVATGHGKPMRGLEMRRRLLLLSRNFKELAVPSGGRYVGRPAITGLEGVAEIPDNRRLKRILIGSGIIVAAGLISFFYARARYSRSSNAL